MKIISMHVASYEILSYVSSNSVGGPLFSRAVSRARCLWHALSDERHSPTPAEAGVSQAFRPYALRGAGI
jgi:hypothetical protein